MGYMGSPMLHHQAAIFAIGLISNNMGNANDVSVKKGDRIAVENVDLLAFWAPFLLVHLGGPDTITAFALKDIELWLRHLLGLVVHRRERNQSRYFFLNRTAKDAFKVVEVELNFIYEVLRTLRLC
nr:hypothetical protein CTI12_AA095370 [Tanacetum cinerariifolium]